MDNGEGMVTFVSNNSFVADPAFDGMRKHLAGDFDLIYVLDLGGNVRKNPKISGTTHNVFGIQVGVSINVFVRHSKGRKIFYNRVDDFWRKEDKFSFLESCGTCTEVKWQEIFPDNKQTWLTKGLRDDFDKMMPLAAKEVKSGIGGEALLKVFCRGIETTRDSWAYNFNYSELCKNMRSTINIYNRQALDWRTVARQSNVDDFVLADSSAISWSSSLKSYLKQGVVINFSEDCIRKAFYRPFCESYLYFDRYLTHRRGRWHHIFPLPSSEDNRIICLKGVGGDKPFFVLMANRCVDVSMVGFGSGTQCFPFLTFRTDGTHRTENVTDWAAEQFSAALATEVDKRQIFHYVYGLLHSPEYRDKYKANLKREFPRIPLPKDIESFRAFVSAGERLGDLHVNYESQQEYPLEKIETPGKKLNWRVGKMKLTKDKSAILYNDFLTLAGIPPEVFEYRLGNRSALEWIIDRYQVRTDKRSGIVNDPNRPEDPQYIVRLIGKVITVSLETVKIVRGLPPM
jgi:predicted helicase